MLVLFKEALQQYRCYLRKSHFDGKSINEFPVKSPVLNLEDIEWKNLVMHWSRSQDEVLSMKSHDNLNFYFSACALRIFFAGNCRRSGNGGPQTCLPATCGMAQVGAQRGPSSSAQAQDPHEGPSLAGWTTGSFLKSSLARQAREEAERSR